MVPIIKNIKIMNKIITSIFVFVAMVLCSCSHSDLYDGMPRKIQTFISQYYPNSQLESFTTTDTSYNVVVKDGPSIVFDANCNWTYINGNGGQLPQVLMFNDLPPRLYSYLEETEDTKNVYEMTRTSKEYTLVLLGYTLHYDIATGEITGDDESSK